MNAKIEEEEKNKVIDGHNLKQNKAIKDGNVW